MGAREMLVDGEDPGGVMFVSSREERRHRMLLVTTSFLVHGPLEASFLYWRETDLGLP